MFLTHSSIVILILGKLMSLKVKPFVVSFFLIFNAVFLLISSKINGL